MVDGAPPNRVDHGSEEDRAGSLSMLVQRAKSEHDVAVVTRLRLTLYTTLDQSNRAVECNWGTG
jgi:hypothetical protein